MGSRINIGGFVVAGIGFVLTRFTVTLAAFDSPLQFYVAGIVPLILGLGLAAFGVALAFSDVDTSLVWATARWCVIGTAAMFGLFFLTFVGARIGEMSTMGAIRSRTFLANFLIGGAVGGTLTGLYAARNDRQQRDLRQQANRLEVLNRLLRHEILNSLTAIRGYASLNADDSDRAVEVIDERASAIEGTIERVKYLTRTARQTEQRGVPIDLETCLESSVETVRDRYPDAEVGMSETEGDLEVLANERLEQVFENLLENAVIHGQSGGEPVEITTTATANTVRVSVRDDGPGLPPEQRRLLEDGDIGTFDDPKAGFGLNVVRLLVESYRGTIETNVEESGSTVTVVLPRADADGTGIQPGRDELTRVRVSVPRLGVTVLAALLAGGLMGLATEVLGGAVPVIGSLYGVRDPIVGWITHEFHSVVFGFVFAGLLTAAPRKYQNSIVHTVGLSVAWSLVLWAGAAGLVMPLWLNLVGIAADVPNLALTPLLTHLTWGLSMGLLVSVGYRRIAPLLPDYWHRLEGRIRRS
jgi:two-component system OmpR family sensor kinase